MSGLALHRKKLPLLLLYLIGWLTISPQQANSGLAGDPVAPLPASAQFKAWVMTKLPDTPEGLGIDSKGNIYATLYHSGEVVLLKQDGSYEHIAWVPSKEESGKGNLVGLDLDKEG